jgi:hypothetical protein
MDTGMQVSGKSSINSSTKYLLCLVSSTREPAVVGTTKLEMGGGGQCGSNCSPHGP